VALVSLCGAACGSTYDGKRSASQTASRDATVANARGSAGSIAFLNDGDNDPSNDNDPDDHDGSEVDDDHDYPEDHLKPGNGSYHDRDDSTVIGYAHAASAAQMREIATVARRYYRVADAANGAAACSMIDAPLAAAIPKDYGGALGPVYMHGKTCAVVTSNLFRHSHDQLTDAVHVTNVRIEGNSARVLLGSRTIPAATLELKERRGVWKVDGLLGIPLR
jgi:hypothetical protein